jgi:hypothetical protein
MQVTILYAQDLKAVRKALREHEDGKRLGKELTAELKAIGRPLVPKVKQAWLSAPSDTPKTRARQGQPDLRQLLAKATWLQMRMTGKEAGVRVRTDGRRMPSGSRALPGYAEGIRRRPWRHPVHGNREEWVTQRPFPRFYEAVQPDREQAAQACQEAVAKMFNQIARTR